MLQLYDNNIGHSNNLNRFISNNQVIINFADDNFCVVWDRNLVALIENLEKRLEMIVKWLKGSGLVVNESKTEICLFHTNDQPQIRFK